MLKFEVLGEISRSVIVSDISVNLSIYPFVCLSICLVPRCVINDGT